MSLAVLILPDTLRIRLMYRLFVDELVKTFKIELLELKIITFYYKPYFNVLMFAKFELQKKVGILTSFVRCLILFVIVGFVIHL